MLTDDDIYNLLDFVKKGAYFCVFILLVSYLKTPLSKVLFIDDIFKALFSIRGKSRYFIFPIVIQGFSMLFNMGAITITREFSKGKIIESEFNRFTLFLMRNTAIMTLWSPIGIGFLIVTSSVANLNTVYFILIMITVSSLFTFFVVRYSIVLNSVESIDFNFSFRFFIKLFVFLSMFLSFLFLAFYLKIQYSMTMIASISFLLLLSSILYFIVKGISDFHEEVMEINSSLKRITYEMHVFMFSSISSYYAYSYIELDLLSFINDLFLIYLSSIVIIVLSLLFIPHVILVIISANVLGSGPIAELYPYTLSISILGSWFIAICASPISSMSLITSNLMNIKSYNLVYHYNLNFVLRSFLLLSLITFLSWFFERSF